MRAGTLRRVAVVVAAIGLGSGLPASRATAQPDGRPTALLRAEQHRLARWIRTTDRRVAALAAHPARASDATVQRIAESMLARLGPRLAWEQQALYPAVDRRAGAAVTLRFRQETRAIQRRLDALRKEASGSPDPRAFARHARAILALMRVHLGREQQILMSVLDRTMTRDELERELLDNSSTAPGPGYPPTSTNHATR